MGVGAALYSWNAFSKADCAASIEALLQTSLIAKRLCIEVSSSRLLEFRHGRWCRVVQLERLLKSRLRRLDRGSPADVPERKASVHRSFEFAPVGISSWALAPRCTVGTPSQKPTAPP